MTLKIFDVKVHFLISPALGRPFFAKNNNLLALTNLTANRYSVASGSRARFTHEARRAEFWVRKTLEAFQFRESLKTFYPPKGCLLADSCRGPIVFTYVLFWVSKTLEAFQFTTVNPPFEISKMFYLPKGSLPAD